MKRYYLDIVPKRNGDNELHHEFCLYVPVIINAKYIGEFATEIDALKEAQKDFKNANGCKSCCAACYTHYEVE